MAIFKLTLTITVLFTKFMNWPFNVATDEDVLVLQYYSYPDKPRRGAEQNGQHSDSRDPEIGLRFVFVILLD